MSGLFAELKRRNVFRVAAVYAVVSWLLVQVTGSAVPALHMPDWVDSFVLFILLIGFPIALILAWALEMTPEGIKLEKNVDREESITGQTGQKINYLLIGGLALLLTYAFFPRRMLRGVVLVALVLLQIASLFGAVRYSLPRPFDRRELSDSHARFHNTLWVLAGSPLMRSVKSLAITLARVSLGSFERGGFLKARF